MEAVRSVADVDQRGYEVEHYSNPPRRGLVVAPSAFVRHSAPTASFGPAVHAEQASPGSGAAGDGPLRGVQAPDTAALQERADRLYVERLFMLREEYHGRQRLLLAEDHAAAALRAAFLSNAAVARLRRGHDEELALLRTRLEDSTHVGRLRQQLADATAAVQEERAAVASLRTHFEAREQQRRETVEAERTAWAAERAQLMRRIEDLEAVAAPPVTAPSQVPSLSPPEPWKSLHSGVVREVLPSSPQAHAPSAVTSAVAPPPTERSPLVAAGVALVGSAAEPSPRVVAASQSDVPPAPTADPLPTGPSMQDVAAAVARTDALLGRLAALR